METIHLHHTKKNPLIIPALIAKQRGIFAKRGLEVELDLAEDFTFDGNSPFREGKSDAMMGDLTFFFYMLEQGKKAVLTSNLTRTIHLVGRKGLTPPYKGIKVGVNRKGLFRLYLENDLKALVPEAQIVWLNNSYERIQALECGEIDALVAIEPFVSDLTDKGHTILWSTRSSDKNLVMWAFDQDFYENHRESVYAFHEALEEAGTYFNGLSGEEKVRLCHEELGYLEAFASRMSQFNFEPQAPIRLEDFKVCMEWMYREQEITQLYEDTKLIKNLGKTY
ncbi:MAG: hypothetical protein RSF92_02065 [Niameybacter sp.]|uniref:ABC transporter substrate-binding protein n=1 Tax=Niameybacter sp. TaxID=2033640 RepID=UPI002FC737B5